MVCETQPPVSLNRKITYGTFACIVKIVCVCAYVCVHTYNIHAMTYDIHAMTYDIHAMMARNY